MGELILSHDWQSSGLASIEDWPQSLKTAVGMMVLSPVPMVLLWGDDGIMIYNDAYSVSPDAAIRNCSARPCARVGRKSPISTTMSCGSGSRAAR